MAIIFNGKKFAADREVSLRIAANQLRAKGVKPQLGTLLIGRDPASKLYVDLKQKAGKRVDVDVEIFNIHQRKTPEYVINLIRSLGLFSEFHGIMVQLPLPKRMSSEKEKIIKMINPEKDVDGMLPDSPFIHPTSLAAIEIVKEGMRALGKKKINKIAVVGATGMVGSAVVRAAEESGFKVMKFSNLHKGQLRARASKADALVSATGKPGLIKPDMVKKGAIVVDVGSPVGDVDPEVGKKAGFITPVPGGVGPVTIHFLLENLLKSAYNLSKHTSTSAS